MKSLLLFAALSALHAETLHYAINWPSGLNLGEATIRADRKGAGWEFATDVDASVPGFAIRDAYKATSDGLLCSGTFEKTASRGSKKTHETLQFDQQKMNVIRLTEPTGPGGGKTETAASACAKDALTFLQFVRTELAQGRVAAGQTVFLGAAYQARVEFTGTQRIKVDGQQVEADKTVVSIKGPASNFTIEVYFSRDAARTPVFARIPLALAAFTVELMR